MQAFLAAQGLHGLQAFLAAHGLHGLQAFLAAHGLHGLQPPFFAAACRRGTKHLLENEPPLAAQGLQGLHPLAAQGLHGLQAFLAAHGLHAFLAAHGLHGLQAFLAAQQAGLHGLHPFLAAHGLHGLQAASWMVRGFGLATGKRVECSDPTFAALASVAGDITPPTAIPTPIKAGMNVVERRVNLNVLTSELLFSDRYWT